MGFTKVNVLVLVLLSVNLALCKTILESSAYRENIEAIDSVIKEYKEPTNKPTTLGMPIPDRVHCEYEEATEDTICQEHCLPKGYNYGLCVGKTCSCI